MKVILKIASILLALLAPVSAVTQATVNAAPKSDVAKELERIAGDVKRTGKEEDKAYASALEAGAVLVRTGSKLDARQLANVKDFAKGLEGAGGKIATDDLPWIKRAIVLLETGDSSPATGKGTSSTPTAPGRTMIDTGICAQCGHRHDEHVAQYDVDKLDGPPRAEYCPGEVITLEGVDVTIEEAGKTIKNGKIVGLWLQNASGRVTARFTKGSVSGTSTPPAPVVSVPTPVPATPAPAPTASGGIESLPGADPTPKAVPVPAPPTSVVPTPPAPAPARKATMPPPPARKTFAPTGALK